MMQALELLRLVKRHISRRSDISLNSEEIKAVAIAVIKLRLSEGISRESVTQSAENSTK